MQELNLFLSHRKIGATSEDEIVDCVMRWMTANIGGLSEDEILQISYNVNWPYVSFDKLLAIYKTFPALRKIQ